LSFDVFCLAVLAGLWLWKWSGGRRPIELQWVIGIAIGSILAEPILLVLHELSHATAGWAMGMRVFGITLGSGPQVTFFDLGRFKVEIRLLPAGGSCRAGLGGGWIGRWRVAAMIAAAPLIHLLVLAVLVCAATFVFGNSRSFVWMGAFVAVFFVNLLALMGNLIPRNLHREGQVTNTDGKQLLRLWRSKDAARAWILSNYTWEIVACLERGAAREARASLEQARRLALDDAAGFRTIELAVMGAEGDWAGAAARAEAWPVDPGNLNDHITLAAWAAVAIVYGRGDLIKAQSLCDELATLTPWEGAVQTVFAVVALARGQDTKAEGWLTEARPSQLNWTARAAGAWAWAELFRRKGNQRLADRWDSRARKLDPIGIFRMPEPGKASELING